MYYGYPLDLVECVACTKKFLKDINHINENKKLGHKFFCSRECLSIGRNKQKEFICSSPSCSRRFIRKPSAVSRNNYCSNSCAATITNRTRVRTKKPKIIRPPRFIHTKETVVGRIKHFVEKNKRLPVKREMNGLYRVSRKFYGNWNKAIEAAGFEPNPILFAKRQIANDGHQCDSLAEKKIDDYLFEHGITHERNYPYPEGDYTADFKIQDKYIEYFGLVGHISYDKLVEIKKNIAANHEMDLIEIYPKNLYRRDGLEGIFKGNFKSLFPRLVE